MFETYRNFKNYVVKDVYTNIDLSEDDIPCITEIYEKVSNLK